MTIQNKVQLITYPDSLGDNLAELHYVLKRYLADVIGGVHILPVYPSSSDRGFAPKTYEEVDPRFGRWKDLELIGAEFDLILDFMVNHISRQSHYYQDFTEKSSKSEYADMFLTFDKLRKEPITDAELEKVYTRKPRPPYIVQDRKDGSREKVWCTFDTEQIDIDIGSPVTRSFLRYNLINLARTRAKMIRLDAIAYVIKKIGTRCFFEEPEIWDVIRWLAEYVRPFGADILPEVHEHHRYQLKLSEKGYWCYDFSLPMLLIHTLYHHTHKELKQWLEICPRKQITTLDTHDGIGVVDVRGLMSDDLIDKTLNGLYEKGSNMKRMYSGAEYHNLDIYQVNCTYYSALENNDDAYLAARTIQFFAPGIPQVYYVGLLAGENDIQLVERTRNGRFINRHNYTLEEVGAAMEKPAVKRLMALMKFRSEYPVFNGTFRIEDCPEDQVVISWTDDPLKATAVVDLRSYKSVITYLDPKTGADKIYHV